MTATAYVLCNGFQHTYLHFIGDILVHAGHCGRTAEGTVRRHMNALLIAPLQQSIVFPVRMHLNLQPSDAHTSAASSCLSMLYLSYFTCHTQFCWPLCSLK